MRYFSFCIGMQGVLCGAEPLTRALLQSVTPIQCPSPMTWLNKTGRETRGIRPVLVAGYHPSILCVCSLGTIITLRVSLLFSVCSMMVDHIVSCVPLGCCLFCILELKLFVSLTILHHVLFAVVSSLCVQCAVYSASAPPMASVLTDHLVRQLHGVLHFDFTSLATLYFYLYHVTHVNCVLSVLLFVFAVLPLVLGDCASLATSLFLECIAEAVLLLNWWPELEFNVWCSSFLEHFHFSIPKYFQCVCSCVFSTISSGVFWCVLVYFQWAILVYFQWAFLVNFQCVRSCVFQWSALVCFQCVCRSLFAHSSATAHCPNSLFIGRGACLFIFLCLFRGRPEIRLGPLECFEANLFCFCWSFSQTRNMSESCGVLRQTGKG